MDHATSPLGGDASTTDDQDDLRHTRRLIRDAAPTLLFQTGEGVYPYEVGKQLEPPKQFSASTNAMVAHSVACIGGMFARSSRLVGFPLLPDRGAIITATLQARAINAVERSIHSIQNQGEAESWLFKSTAFGDDDPFTIGWALELLDCLSRWPSQVAKPDLTTAIKRVRTMAKNRVRKALEDPDRPVLRSAETKHGQFVVHPLPLLRIVQVARLLEDSDGSFRPSNLPDAFEWFLGHLHLQLSRRSIQHSGFDIAELTFCLEGMLASGRPRVTRSILESVIVALNESRKLNSSLRASMPFRVTSIGAVHLFTSVEVVASLLRSAMLLDAHDQSWFFEALKPTLSHYLSWLQATMLQGETSLPSENDAAQDPYPDDTPTRFAGWQSEHSHTSENSVHIWFTSQVLLFLRSYETLLSADVADAALIKAGLLPEFATPRPEPTENRKQASQAADPLQLEADSQYRVVSRLNELFVEPHENIMSTDAPYSCLLYGPPGTGKTTLARQVASDLGWPLLTVTTSDFILDGEAQVEARAKLMFSTLQLQSGMVVFFDEIDRLLLDRDNASYGLQGDMLQFMTPSMLTKINDLRRTERCIFIIGTNYADRIDSAIKRAGRIDHKFLVMPPDFTRRRTFLAEEIAKIPSNPTVEEGDLDKAAEAGAGQTIAELYSALQSFARHGGSIAQHVSGIAPALSLSTYGRRFATFDGQGMDEIVERSRELVEEAYLVAYILNERKRESTGETFQLLANQWASVRKSNVVRDDQVIARLEELFTS